MKGHIVYGMMAAAMLAVSVPAYGAQLPAENGAQTESAAETETIVETETSAEKETTVETETSSQTETDEASGDTAEENKEVRDFVRRLYELVLGRPAEADGLDAWTDRLVSGAEQGAKVAQGFFDSEEFKARNVSDTEYLQILYRTCLNREADDQGLSEWQAVLDSGLSRLFVFRGFVESDEFTKICQSYGIQRGNAQLTAPMDQNEDVTKFVARCYRLCLGRGADADGLNAWCSQLLSGANTAKEAAYGFVFSNEFINSNLSDEDFVKIMYQLFLNRTWDEEGLNEWADVLKEYSRRHVFNGFADSPEFEQLCQSYGLTTRTAAEKELQGYVNQVLAQVTDDSMTKMEKFRACYDWVLDNCSYRAVFGDVGEGYTFEQWYAVNMFKEHRGNCYSYASTVYAFAQALDFTDAVMVKGYFQGVTGRLNNTWSPHAWVEIGGLKYDAQQEDEQGWDCFGNPNSPVPYSYTAR